VCHWLLYILFNFSCIVASAVVWVTGKAVIIHYSSTGT